MDQGHLGREARRTPPPVYRLTPEGRRVLAPAAEDVGGIRGGGAARDGRRTCLIGHQSVRARLSSLRLSPARENEIVDELSQHLEDRWRELLAGGASEDEATRLALAEFREGNLLAQYMAPLRQAHAPASLTPGASTGHVLPDVWLDLRYADADVEAASLQGSPPF